MRIGVWGGTFDPVHVGHLLIAERAREQFMLDQVRWIPAALAPHVTLKQSTDSNHRLAMVQLAINGNMSFVCDDRELRRGGKSYTIDTLGELAQEFPGAELFFLMGADSLREFGNWKHPAEICKAANIVIVARGGQPKPDLQALNQYLSTAKTSEQLERGHLLQMPQVEISSTEIRDRITRGLSIRYAVPAAVEAYIAQQRLYQTS
ncbi:MAG: nicotinate-nucleotide adenylyltransferase [Pirellulales bacterium]